MTSRIARLEEQRRAPARSHIIRMSDAPTAEELAELAQAEAEGGRLFDVLALARGDGRHARPQGTTIRSTGTAAPAAGGPDDEQIIRGNIRNAAALIG